METALQTISEAKQSFETRGFAVFPAVLRPDELTDLRAACDEMIDIAKTNPKDIFCNYYLPHRIDQGALYDVYQRHPSFRRIAETETVLNAVRAVYSEEFYLFENSVVYKPEGAQNEVPWHQDYMYMTDDPDKVIAWLPADDVNEENGCMYVIPGSHRLGPLRFHSVRGETHSKRTDSGMVNEHLAEPVILKAGDLLLFHQFLLHSSRRVPGTIKRRAYRFALKSISNSYTPRATPIVLSVKCNGALLRPYQGTETNSLLARFGRRISRLGRRLEGKS